MMKIKKFYFILLFLFTLFSVYSEIDPSPQQGKQVASVCSAHSIDGDGNVNLNIRDNIILSAVTLCIPGILENIEEYKQIKCEEVVCKYTSIANGIPATHCSKQAAYRICANVYGDIFALPWFSIVQFVDGFKQALVTYYSQPYVALITTLRFAKTGCAGYCTPWDNTGVDFILNANDFAAAIQRIKDIFDAGFEPQRGVDYCAQIDSMGIVDEVNTILGVEK